MMRRTGRLPRPGPRPGLWCRPWRRPGAAKIGHSRRAGVRTVDFECARIRTVDSVGPATRGRVFLATKDTALVRDPAELFAEDSDGPDWDVARTRFVGLYYVHVDDLSRGR